MATAAEYVQFGRKPFFSSSTVRTRSVYQELIAKAADRQPSGMPRGVYRIDRHHLNAARQELLAEGEITESTAATRGMRRVTVMHRPLQRG